MAGRLEGEGEEFPFDVSEARESELSAKEFTLDLLRTKFGPDVDVKEIHKEEWCQLEMQTIWCRYVRDQATREHAIRA